MSPIGGAGGPGGVGGPKGPDGPDDVGDVADVGTDSSVSSATAAKAAGGLEAMASEIAAGRLTPREAVDKIVDEIAGTDQLGAGERAELRELLSDLVENDPYLQSLVGRA
ncbi:MAG TPA: hypothetical protein VL326_07730 [Kofleriaceae bacterium]|jgi:hypothetical protein|nr:hypothetical protein [Kofleriaceae bacterium]